MSLDCDTLVLFNVHSSTSSVHLIQFGIWFIRSLTLINQLYAAHASVTGGGVWNMKEEVIDNGFV